MKMNTLINFIIAFLKTLMTKMEIMLLYVIQSSVKEKKHSTHDKWRLQLHQKIKFGYRKTHVYVEKEKGEEHEFEELPIHDNHYKITKKEMSHKRRIKICKQFIFKYENEEVEESPEIRKIVIIEVLKILFLVTMTDCFQNK